MPTVLCVHPFHGPADKYVDLTCHKSTAKMRKRAILRMNVREVINVGLAKLGFKEIRENQRNVVEAYRWHVLKPETTKRNERNETTETKRPNQAKRNEMTETSETTETSKIISK